MACRPKHSHGEHSLHTAAWLCYIAQKMITSYSHFCVQLFVCLERDFLIFLLWQTYNQHFTVFMNEFLLYAAFAKDPPDLIQIS